MNILIKSAVGLVGVMLFSGCSCNVKHARIDDTRARMGEVSDESISGSAMDNVYFAFDRYDLSEASRGILRKNAEWLKEHKNVAVKIEGHADERGTTEYNLALGMDRAEAASIYLRSLGIDATRISTISYGEEMPLDPGHNEAAWAKNRRDEFNALSSELPKTLR